MDPARIADSGKSATLTTDNPASDKAAVINDLATFTAVFDQPVKKVQYSIAGARLQTQEFSSATLTFQATHVFTDLDPAGDVAVRLLVTDESGNVNDIAINNTGVVYNKDDVPTPEMRMFSVGKQTGSGASLPSGGMGTAYQNFAKEGDVITLRLITQGSNAATITVTINNANASVIPYTDNTFTTVKTAFVSGGVGFDAKYWQATAVVANSSPQGNAIFTAQVNDILGRLGKVERTLIDNTPVKIDIDRPTITFLEARSNNSNPEQAKTGDEITIQLRVNESTFITSGGRSNATATVFGQTVTPTPSGDKKAFTVKYTVRSSDSGRAPFTITLDDLASNTLEVLQSDITRGLSVLVDNEKPNIVSQILSDDNSYVEITFNEPVYGDNAGTSSLASNTFTPSISSTSFFCDCYQCKSDQTD